MDTTTNILSEQDLQNDLIQTVAKDNTLRNKVRSMFFLQNELNCLIDSDWANKPDRDFNRASMIELCELMDHYGYKWWKAQTPDVNQCQLEVIDIAHFHISRLEQLAIVDHNKYDFYVDEFLENIQPVEVAKDPESIRKLIDECVFLASSKNFSSKQLGLLMAAFDLTPDDLCNKYILKNTLNIFRACNGYKQGTYKKIWNGKEDNEVLMDVFSTMDPDSESLADDLYVNLEEAYKLVA